MVKVRLLGGPCDGYDDERRMPVDSVALYQVKNDDGRAETHAYEWAHFSCDEGRRWVLRYKCQVATPVMNVARCPRRERARRIGFLSGGDWSRWQLERLADGDELVVGMRRYAACDVCDKIVRLNKPVLGGLHFCTR